MTQAMKHFDDPAFATAFSHLRGQSVRVGGITADWLIYSVNATVADECRWGARKPFTLGGGCPFTTGSFDRLADFLRSAGVGLLFDLNELIGRNCTWPGPHPWNPPEWCGDKPATWDLAPVRGLLTHIAQRGLEGIVGFELGNELFMPPHLSHESVDSDVLALSSLLAQTWGGSAPRLFATGTNDCMQHSNNCSATLSTLARVSAPVGFSFHSYPGNAPGRWWNASDLTSYLLNATWLRTATLAATAPCLAAWNRGPRSKGIVAAVTEAAATYGRQDVWQARHGVLYSFGTKGRPVSVYCLGGCSPFICLGHLVWQVRTW